jgi:hypothetical protein
MYAIHQKYAAVWVGNWTRSGIEDLEVASVQVDGDEIVQILNWTKR